MSLRSRIIRLAHLKPELRPHLLPLVSKVGMEFATQDAMDKYLKDHPKSDKSKHSVAKPKDKKPKNDKEPLKKVRDTLIKDRMESPDKGEKPLTQDDLDSLGQSLLGDKWQRSGTR